MNDIAVPSFNGLEIAVIGMAGRFPAAPDVESLWDLLAQGREGLANLSDSHLDASGVGESERAQPNYVRLRGVIERKHEFDAALFGYTGQDAATMDPQFCVLHELAWQALESSGYAPAKYAGLIGLYAGASGNLAWMHRIMQTSGSLADYYSVTSLNEAGYLATRVAHRLDLTGPALSTNTTCSTSLVNIHLACQGLIAGECDIALAGGVSVSIDNKGYLHQEGMVLSSDGHCRPFDAAADGTGAGEGAGLLVLKRLDDALADNDTVLAIIKGSAINNDGQRKVGFTAPSSDGQAAVIRTALDRAEVEPASIGYVEAHGTATRLGDPIEVSALRQAFGAVAAGSCAIGSVKSNIGHLGEAAGVAGAIKTILALQHRQLPASLNFHSPNAMIGLEGSPFFVNTALREWTAKAGEPLRAGVSSFGIGGTNAHVILEQAPPSAAPAAGRPHHAVFLSANSPSALDALEANLIAHAAAHPGHSIADLCFTLQVGRRDLPYRRAFAVADMAQLALRVSTAAGSETSEGHIGKAEPGLCFVFPGQGSQYRCMGRGLYENEAVFREQADACFAVAQRISGLDLRAALYEETDALVSTALVQPLLFVLEYALARMLLDWGLRPQAYLGHSLGEYVAACLAGVFTLEDAIDVVVARGRLVEALPAGAMLALPVSEARARELLGDALDLAAVNAPERVTVSGDIEAINRLQQQLADEGVHGVRLATSHAFHSRHLDPILEPFAQVLRRVTLSSPRQAFLSNVTGTWITADEATSVDYWVQHLRGTVRFAEGVATLCSDKLQVLLEVGPGRALGRFAQQGHLRPSHCIGVLPQASNPHAAPAAEAEFIQLQTALCQLFTAGIAVDGNAYHRGQARRRVRLPTYPFEGHCHYSAEVLSARGSSISRSLEARVAASASVSEDAAAGPGAASSTAGMNDVQAKLVAIWKQFLGRDVVGLHEDVFELGVDSLLSIRVIGQIRETFATDITLDSIFVLRTVAEQAAEIERRLLSADAPQLPAILAYGHHGPAPLSTSQKRLWIISQLEGERTAYNNGFCMFLHGADATVLERAFRTVIQRHASLRTRYREMDGVPMQEVHEDFEFQLQVADISTLDADARFVAGERMWQDALSNPINLASDLMLRAALVRYDDATHLLMVTQHHICSDNWSNNLLMQEVGVLYDAYLAGNENPLPPLPVQYIDYAIWQEAWLRTGVLERELPYWRKTLAGIPHVHNLPLDRPRPKYQSYRGQQYGRRIDASVLQGLERIGRQNGATLFMTMQAAFSLFLARYSGETDIVLGFSVANRLHKELESVIGFFVNSLVLRSDLSDNPSFNAFVGRTKQSLLGAYANAHVPFEILVDELKPARSMSYEPIAQIQLIYLDQSQDQGGKVSSREDKSEVVHANMQVPFSKYDLTLYFSVDSDGMALTWEYATDLFEAETIGRMSDSLEALLRGIVAAPEQAVHDLPMTDEPSARRLPATLQATGNAAGGEFEFSLFYFASDDGGRANDKYHLLMEGARFADRYGFEAVWTPERHFDAFGGAYPNPAITAAALAAATTRVKLRAGSCVLPLHHPVRVAEDWSVIDNLSGGRVGIGFAAGFSPRDFALAPDRFEGRRDVLVRDVQTVKALWRGEAVTLQNGKAEMVPISIRPRPIQPELPVWVTTVGNEEAFRHAGRMGDNILTHLMGHTLEELAVKIAVYREERAAAGHAGNGIITLLVHTFISEDEQTIFDKVRGPFKQYLIDSVGTPQTIAKSLGLGDIGGAAGEGGDIDAITEFAFRRYYQSSALFGTAERCLPLIASIRKAGVNEVACLIDFGVEPELVLESLPRLGHLRDLAIPASRAKVRDGAVAVLPSVPAQVQATVAPMLMSDAAQAVVDEDLGADVAGAPVLPCIHHLFEQACERSPQAIAVVHEDTQLTYAELNARANRLAHRLIAEHGIVPEMRVGLCCGRSVDMVVGMLAVLKAGAAYLPIEPDVAPLRIAQLLEDGGAGIVLTRGVDASAVSQAAARPVLIDDLQGAAVWSDQNPMVEVSASNAAYVIYTSGSTGRPKGVVVEHRSPANFWQAMTVTSHAGLGDNAHIAVNASVAFDMSLEGLLQLLSGHRVHIIPNEVRLNSRRMLEFLQRYQIEVFDITPSQFSTLLAAGFATMQGHRPGRVLLGGEAINPALWNAMRNCEGMQFYNMYGPTECTVSPAIGRVEAADETPHIGTPIPNLYFRLLDQSGHPVARGAVGEIHIGGVGVARGYLNQPQQTAEKFIEDLHGGVPGARLYRTGDLGRWLTNGKLAYLGRNDNQIKLRGFRVELGEIESCLLACEGIMEAVVLAKGEDSGRYLVAYAVHEDGVPAEAGGLRAAIKRQLSDVLPHYMVPESYVFLAQLPLTGNGKLDRDALDHHAVARPSFAYQAPRSDTERQLSQIWEGVMGGGDVGIHADFFELGGQSLIAIRVINEITERFNIELDTRVIFEYSTIESLATHIDNLLWLRTGGASQAGDETEEELEIRF
ncbi:non-ribosomal peptide synthetase/type I polyketide synthase [Stenotrophomonas indicatrix]|uniref:non-ribosomal peptide synthetase/type I polyketide synthase n=1 Tax=Stenotrophomonas indicatrix TaxID=2045451 RepID=UPI0028AE7395|nr:MupA/Atu3671 family FMN-dependent luciferase-like monooxygenase [Stenotrophomonas indicatrix]